MNQDKLGHAGKLISKDGDAKVWAKPLHRGTFAVVFFTAGICLFAFTLCTLLAGQETKEPETSPFKIEVKVNKVLIPVVVRDAQHHTVGDLKKEDFQVFEKDKPQIISGFTVEKRNAAESSNPAPPNTHAVVQQPVGSPRFIVFLFDDMHLEAEDLGRIQKLGIKLLTASLTGSDMAAVVSTSGANSGLMRDRTKLEEAIMKLKPQSLYRHQGRQCPDIDYYEADLIENKHDGNAFEAAVKQTLACANLDPQSQRRMVEGMVRSAATNALATGDQDVRVTLAALREFVRKTGTLPGQRTLILISPGFLTLTAEAMTEKTQILDLAAQSSVTISALDARGLYTTELDASQRGAGSAMTMQSGYESQSHRASMTLNEDVMAELADGSGGSYFHNSNDLEAGFKNLVAPEYVYILEISLDKVKPDGAYHHLKVKVNRDDLQLQARRGYFAPTPDKQAKNKSVEKESEKQAPERTNLVKTEPEKAKLDNPTTPIADQNTSPTSSVTKDTKPIETKLSNRSLNWTPPLVDAPFRPDVSSPLCALSKVLTQAGARAGELYASLQSFSADEKIEYQASDHMGYLQDARTGTFDYVVLFDQTQAGTTIREDRQPRRGSKLLTAFTQDIGLPEMALMFLPEIQRDYEMNCEGSAEWNKQSVYVVHFVNRKDQPGHTLSFRDSKGKLHPVRLKGRAWIAADSGEVVHMETSLMEEIPGTKMRHWYLSISYAPVEFHAQNVRMLLPQTVDAYSDFEDHRTIVYHTFTDFKLFSVDTGQTVEKTKGP